MTNLTEREKQLVAWMRDLAATENQEPMLEGNPIVAVLWGLCHPFRLGRWAATVAVLSRAANAIERGDPWETNNG